MIPITGTLNLFNILIVLSIVPSPPTIITAWVLLNSFSKLMSSVAELTQALGIFKSVIRDFTNSSALGTFELWMNPIWFLSLITMINKLLIL